jgi:glycosyltransferase involved in cell wall biosynthesis
VKNAANPTLTVVIPALNEEEVIGQTIQRCLDARRFICEQGGVGRVEIIVVSDGSTDRTADIARGYAEGNPDVRLIIFEKNRGYGAAIKEGFRVGTGEFLGFLDADGTCDPRFFGPLCKALQAKKVDVALGDRMGPTSRMPAVRRLGNRVFAFLLGFLSGDAVNDTASGMRVLRRDALALLYPLPEGMDFTPAMSARAVMSGLRIIEEPMEYADRVGQSKLRAVKDGLRFLRAIIDATFLYRPSRLFRLAFTVNLLLFLVLALSPTEFYLQNRYLEEWMIYRFVLCLLLALTGFMLLTSSVVADDLFFLAQVLRPRGFGNLILHKVFSQKPLLVLAGASATTSLVLAWPGLVEYALTRHITMHWSRLLASAFGLLLALQCIVTVSLRRIISLWHHHLTNMVRDERKPTPAKGDDQQAGEPLCSLR